MQYLAICRGFPYLLGVIDCGKTAVSSFNSGLFYKILMKKNHMDFQYLFIFPFLQEASKKEYKFSFFPPILLLKMAWREWMQWENKVKGYEFSKIRIQNCFPYSGLQIQSNTFFFLFKKRNLNTVAYISTRYLSSNVFIKKCSELLAFCSKLLPSTHLWYHKILLFGLGYLYTNIDQSINFPKQSIQDIHTFEKHLCDTSKTLFSKWLLSQHRIQCVNSSLGEHFFGGEGLFHFLWGRECSLDFHSYGKSAAIMVQAHFTPTQPEMFENIPSLG